MQQDSGPVIKDVVLVGAGHAHVQVLRTFGMEPLPGVRLDADHPRGAHALFRHAARIDRRPSTTFDEAHIDTGPLCRFAGARLYQSDGVGVDLAAGTVLCDNRPPVPYDLFPSTSAPCRTPSSVPGAAEHAIPVKPISGFLAHFEALAARVLAMPGAARASPWSARGAGGVELAVSLERRLRREIACRGL